MERRWPGRTAAALDPDETIVPRELLVRATPRGQREFASCRCTGAARALLGSIYFTIAHPSAPAHGGVDGHGKPPRVRGL